MENYGQGNSLKNLRKVATIFMLVMAGIVFPAIVFVGCDTGGGSDSNNTNGDEAFNRTAFLDWANDPARTLTMNNGNPQQFAPAFIEAVADFARDNWVRGTHTNDPATFRQLTRMFAEDRWPADSPVTITKGGKTFNNDNPLGSFMLEQRRTRAV